MVYIYIYVYHVSIEFELCIVALTECILLYGILNNLYMFCISPFHLINLVVELTGKLLPESSEK